MVFGVNVTGTLAQAPTGQLDVWVRAPVLSQAVDVPEEAIRLELRKSFSARDGKDSCITRISSRDEAERLVNQLKRWAGEGGTKMAA